MIVRIATEDQFRLPDEDVERLNEIDNQAQEAVDAGDEARFQELLQKMIDLVHADGEKVADDELVESDVIIPPADSTIEDLREHFTGEGLIPD